MGIKIKRKLGERIVKISTNLNIPRITVERVIRAYLDDLVESAKAGETIVIDNIMSIKLIKNENTGEVKLRGRVSPALKNKIYVKPFSNESEYEIFDDELVEEHMEEEVFEDDIVEE